MHEGLNTDAFWQLAAGNWMLTHHAVIRTDVFSYTVRGRPWFAEEWGFEVLLAWMVHHIGPVSYWLVSGVVCALALLASALRWSRQGADGLWIAALSVPIAMAIFIGDSPRPQSLSYLFFALELLLLTLARSQRAWLLGLPVLFLLWANLHGSFIMGIGILALELIIAVFASTRSRAAERWDYLRSLRLGDKWSRLRISQPLRASDATIAFIACGLVTLVNPHGPSLWNYAFRVTTSSQLSIIQEWQSPDFHNLVTFIAIALPILVAVVILSTGRAQTEVFDLVIWIGLLIASLHAFRFTPYLGIAYGGLAAPWIHARRSSIRPTWLTLPGAAILCFGVLAGSHLAAGTLQKSAAPAAAARWLQHQNGRVFSTYAWDDYLIGRGIPVFVDGRTDLYFGTQILATYVAVSDVSQRPDPVLSQWHVRWVLWPAHSTLSNYLGEDRRWHLVRRFNVGEIFERVGGG